MTSATELPHPDRTEIRVGDVLFALSDPDRREIARQLRDGPMDATDCVPWDPSMPKSTKSHRFKVLREAGVVRNDPNGRNRTLSLRRGDLDELFPGLLDAILSAEDAPEAPDVEPPRA